MVNEAIMRENIRRMLIDLNVSPSSKFYNFIGRRLEFAYRLNHMMGENKISFDGNDYISQALTQLSIENQGLINQRVGYCRNLPYAEKWIVNKECPYMEYPEVIDRDIKTISGLEQVSDLLAQKNPVEALDIAGQIYKDVMMIREKDYEFEKNVKELENRRASEAKRYKSKNGPLSEKRRKMAIALVAGTLMVSGITGIVKLENISDLSYTQVSNTHAQTQAVQLEETSNDTKTVTPIYEQVEYDFSNWGRVENMDYLQSTSASYEHDYSDAGKYEALVEHMDEGLIAVIADAVREGDRCLPGNYNNGDVRIAIPGLSDYSIVRDFFTRMDEVQDFEKDRSTIAYHMGPVLEAIVKYDIMQQKGVPIENMEFYYRYDSRDAAKAVSLQQVEIRNGIYQRVGDHYFINGNKDSKNPLTLLSIAGGTFNNVLGNSHKIGYAEIQGNGVLRRCF